MRNAGLDEVLAGIKTAGRNINTLDMQMTPPLMAESEELKNPLDEIKSEIAGSTLRKLRSGHLVPSLHGKYMEWKQ